MHCKHLLSALFALAPVAAAQNAVLRGEIADGRATGCYYCPGSQYTLKWVGTRLESSTINLAQYLVGSQMVEMTGTWDGLLLHITAVQSITSSFSFSGNVTLGGRLRMTAAGGAGDLAINAISLGTTFQLPFGTAPLLLAPATAAMLDVGVTGGNGELHTNLDIPQNPSLVGLRVNGQAFFQPTNGVAWSSNVDTAVVQ